MSYITDIKSLFNIIEPTGTFLFTSEVRADDILRNIDPTAYPIFVVDDAPLTTKTVINNDASGIDTPALSGYCLTKFDSLGGQVEEQNSTRLYQHEECIEPMKTLAIRVLGKYFREGSGVLRDNAIKPTLSITDTYNLWAKMLYGVKFQVQNLNIRRVINYCNPPTE